MGGILCGKTSLSPTNMCSLLIAFTCITIAVLSEGTCYLPNGTSHDDEGTQACSFDATNPLYATCCHGRWPNPSGNDTKYGPTKDTCLPNGLCKNKGYSTIEGDSWPPWTHYYRVYCLNKDWSDCLSVCDTGVCKLRAG